MDRVEGSRSSTLRQGWSFVFGAGSLVIVSLLVIIGVARPSVTRPAYAETMTAEREVTTVDDADARVMAEVFAPPPRPSSARYLSLGETQLETSVGSVQLRSSRATAGEIGAEPRVMTMLHGACSDVSRTCQAVADAVPDGFVLLCPTGNRACGDAADWGGEGEQKATHLDTAVEQSARALDLAVDRGGDDILVGFSRGAFVARDVAYARPGKYSGLVLIGAALSPDPELLRASGVKKVVLASGELDGAYRTMRSAETKLRASGIEVRFVSLGNVYHMLPPDTATRLGAALEWVAL